MMFAARHIDIIVRRLKRCCQERFFADVIFAILLNIFTFSGAGLSRRELILIRLVQFSFYNIFRCAFSHCLPPHPLATLSS
jgi:hypothetical protein